MKTAPYTTAFIIGLTTAVEFTITYVVQQHLTFLTPIIWGALGGSAPTITLALTAHDCKHHGGHHAHPKSGTKARRVWANDPVKQDRERFIGGFVN